MRSIYKELWSTIFSSGIELITTDMRAAKLFNGEKIYIEISSFITWDVEELLWFKGSRLIFIDLAEVLIKLLKFLLADYRVKGYDK